MLVGLLRILGYQLPAEDPCCLLGESRVLRWADSPLTGDIPELVRRIEEIPDGVVWKDPAVAVYADEVDWSDWDVIRVTRNHRDVAASEVRWLTGPVDEQEMAERAAEWSARLDRIPAAETFEAGWVREAPLYALDTLTHELGLSTPTGGHRALAQAFIRHGGGYFCPLPGACGVDEAGHLLC